MTKMTIISRLTGSLILFAFAVSLFPGAAHGDALLNIRFAGQLYAVDDPVELFGSNQVGDPFSGVVTLCDGDLVSNFNGLAEYANDVVGHSNRFAALAANQQWLPATNYTTYVAGPGFGLVGIAFQFNIDQSQLNLSQTQPGFEIFDAALSISFLSTNLNLPSSYPNLPDSFHPLSAYDYDRNFLLYVNWFNPTNNTTGSAALIGEVTTIENIPDLGDVNLDGSVDLLDIAPFVNLITSGEFQAEADINLDGVVNLLDVQPFVQLLTGG